MKKLMLIAFLGATVGSAWGSAMGLGTPSDSDIARSTDRYKLAQWQTQAHNDMRAADQTYMQHVSRTGSPEYQRSLDNYQAAGRRLNLIQQRLKDLGGGYENWLAGAQ